jgi:hypothetical protein
MPRSRRKLSWHERCCLARVRVLALAGQAAAGGEVRPDQLRRALDPLLRDLLPLAPWDHRPAEGSAVRRSRRARVSARL